VIDASLHAIRSEPPLAPRAIDVTGALSVTGGLVAIAFAMVRSQAWGFGSPRTIGVFLGGVALLFWFVFHESRVAGHPLVPLRVFSSRSLSASNAVIFLVGCAMFAAFFFFVSLYRQQVLGYSPLKAGVAFLPMALGIVAGSALATQLTGRLGPTPPLVAGLAPTALGMLLITGLSVSGSFAETLLLPELGSGLGLGLAFVPVTISAVAGVPADEAGLDSGLITTSRSVGGALWLAALATIASNRTNDLLAGQSPLPQLVHAALTRGFKPRVCCWRRAGTRRGADGTPRTAGSPAATTSTRASASRARRLSRMGIR
jgi:hypothetical protein